MSAIHATAILGALEPLTIDDNDIQAAPNSAEEMN